MTGSNRRPPACKAGALPAELIPQLRAIKSKNLLLIGLVSQKSLAEPDDFCWSNLNLFAQAGRTKLLVISVQCQEQPIKVDTKAFGRFSRKEVIQPHLPIRLPCYDFTPVTKPTVVTGLLAVSLATSGKTPLPWCDGRCVQGPGTYSPRHADPRLLAIPTSRSRVADCDPDYDRLSGIGSPSRVGNPLYRPLYDVCSPTHKGHEDLTSSPPSSGLSPAVPLECPTKCSN